MTLWLDSKMDKYVLAYFKKALTYEIGVSHVDKVLNFYTGETSSMTVSEFKLTAPQLDSAIKNLDRLLDLPTIDVNAIVSVATSNTKVFTTFESKNVVASIVTTAYENLRDIWKLEMEFENRSVKLGWETASLILDFDGIMRNVIENVKGFDGTGTIEFYKNVDNVRNTAWSNVNNDASSVFVLDDTRYLATKN